MTVLLFSNLNPYLQTHEGFKLETIHNMCVTYNWWAFIRPTVNIDINYLDYPRFFFSTVRPTHCHLKTQIDQVIRKLKPTQVVNLMEKFFPWDLVNCDAENIYFVRSCATKLLEMLRCHNDDSVQAFRAICIYEELAEREQVFMARADRLLTDSPNSAQALSQTLGYHGVPVCLQFIDPRPYNSVASPTDKSNCVYNVGRRDYQKGLQFVKPPLKHDFISIGGPAVGLDDIKGSATHLYPAQTFDQYRNLIQLCNYGIFPSIWESNGYAVQECLAMGKIPIVQHNSGGNEYLCNIDNSHVFDFDHGQGDWEEVIQQDNWKTRSEAAQDTLTYTMYQESLEKFVNEIS